MNSSHQGRKRVVLYIILKICATLLSVACSWPLFSWGAFTVLCTASRQNKCLDLAMNGQPVTPRHVILALVTYGLLMNLVSFSSPKKIVTLHVMVN